MKLHIVYRSSAGENRKQRPHYYSKLLSLASFLQTTAACEPGLEVIYLNDGEIPAARAQLMAASGEVVSLPPLRDDEHGGSRRAGIYRSYIRALDLVDARRWPDGDLVYFAEDDYLYLPEALPRLLTAAQQLPQASYFAFHASIVWNRTIGFWVDDELWHTAESATSSFAARVGALRRDRQIHRVAFNVGHDTQVCLAIQGIRPYRWAYILGDLLGNEPAGRRPFDARIKVAAAQAYVNLLATQASLHRHLLVSPQRKLATHLELPYIASGEWETVARDTVRWAEDQHNLSIPLG